MDINLSLIHRTLTAASLAELIDALRQQGVQEDVLEFARSQDSKAQGRLLSELRKNTQLTVDDLQEFLKPEEDKNSPVEVSYVKQHCPIEMQDWALIQLRKLRKMGELDPEANKRGDIPYDLFMEKISGEIKDWSQHARPRPQLISFDWKQAMQASDEWHAAIAAGGAGKTYQENDPSLIVYGPHWKNPKFEGWTLRQVKTQNDMQVEGFLLHHCVGGGGYVRSSDEGRCRIYSLRDSNENPVFTIETSGDGHNFVQIKGFGNRGPTKEEKFAIAEAFRLEPPKTIKPEWKDPAMAGWTIQEVTDPRFCQMTGRGSAIKGAQLLVDPQGEYRGTITGDPGEERASFDTPAVTPEVLRGLRAHYGIQPPVKVFQQPVVTVKDKSTRAIGSGGWSIWRVEDPRHFDFSNREHNKEDDDNTVYELRTPSGKAQGHIEVSPDGENVVKVDDDPKAGWGDLAKNEPFGYDQVIEDWVKSGKGAPTAWLEDPREGRYETSAEDFAEDLSTITRGNRDKYGLLLPLKELPSDMLDDAKDVLEKDGTGSRDNTLHNDHDIPEGLVDAAAAIGPLELAHLQQALWDKNDECSTEFSDNYYSYDDGGDPEPDRDDDDFQVAREDYETEEEYKEAVAEKDQEFKEKYEEWEKERDDRERYAEEEAVDYMPWALYHRSLKYLQGLQEQKKIPDQSTLCTLRERWQKQNLREYIKKNIKLKKNIVATLESLTEKRAKDPVKYPKWFEHTWHVPDRIGGRNALSEAMVKLALKNKIPIPLDLKYYKDKLTEKKPRVKLSNR